MRTLPTSQPASQHAQPPGRSSTTTTTTAATSTAPPAARLRPCFLGGKEGGGLELLGDNNCNRVRPGRLGCPPPQIPHVAILTQPRGTSRGRRRPVVVQSPFPSRNGGSSATRTPTSNWACGRSPIGKGAILQPGFGPAMPSSACACCCAVASLPPAPEKTRGHGPAPVTAQVVPSPVPVSVQSQSQSQVPVPGPVVVTISIWPVLQKLSIDYLIVECYAQCQHP